MSSTSSILFQPVRMRLLLKLTAPMADYPHTIDRWDDATGENLIEQIAAVGDYLVALETYRAAVKRAGRRTRSRCAIGRG
jgi:hypothetical protein